MTNEDLLEQNAIICATNQSLKSVLREGVRQAGISATMILDKTSDAVRELKAQPKAWLLLDHKIPPEDLSKILTAAQGPTALTTRPIYLVTGEFQPKTVTMALEFNVGKVRFGDLNAAGIEQDLKELNKAYSKKSVAAEQLSRAHSLIAQKKTAEASELFRSILETHGNNSAILVEYIDFLLLSNDLDLAKKHLDEAHILEPNDIRIQHLQARFYMSSKNYEEGIRILESLEESNPWSPNRLVDLGHALLTTSRFKDAKARFEKALSIDPNNASAKSGQAQSVLLEGNMKDGIDLLRNLGSTRQVASTLNAAAVCASRGGRFDEARGLYENGIKLLFEDKESCARIWYNMGILEHRAEDFQKAIKCFEQSMKADPKFKDAKANFDILSKQVGESKKNKPTTTKETVTDMKTISLPTRKDIDP